MHIWAIAITHLDEYVWFGKGAGSSRPFLLQKYEQYNAPQLYRDRKYNDQNQYLEETIELGIPGLYLLLSALVSLWFVSLPRTRIYATYFLILIMLNLLTESMLGRTDGIITIALFSLLFVVMNRKEMESVILLNQKD